MGLREANFAFFAFCFGGIGVVVGTLKLLRPWGGGVEVPVEVVQMQC